MDVDWFRDTNHIIKSLEDKPAHSRKTSIASLMALVGKEHVSKDIVDMMVSDKNTLKAKYTSQEMSEKQKDNWIPMDEVNAIESRLLDIIKPILSQKHPVTSDQMKMIVDWLLVALTSGRYFSPRRSEWQYVKLKDVNQETDNYIDLKKGAFVLNRYKTAKLYGREEIPYGKPFGVLLKKVLALIPDQTYLLEHKGKPFNSSTITSRLNSIFGKKVSTSMLRHIYITDKYKDMPALKELTANAQAMGHSVVQSLQYALRA
jgi:hypothetical protein